MPKESPCSHVHRLSEGRVHLVQATGGKKPLACATAAWTLLVLAIGVQILLVGSKGIKWVSEMWCLLSDLQAAGTTQSSHLRNHRESRPPPVGVCDQVQSLTTVTSEVRNQSGHYN